MKRYLPVLCLLVAAIAGRSQAQEKKTVEVAPRDATGSASRGNPLNPAPFRGFLATPSGTIRFLLSPEGIKLARNSSHPNLRDLLQRWGIAVGPAPAAVTGSGLRRQPVAVAASAHRPCSNFRTGTSFNLEPETGMPEIGIPVPRNEESVDFIPGGGIHGADLVIGGANDYRGFLDAGATGGGTVPNSFGWGFSGTGYYVNRSGGCGADFEGGLPHIFETEAQQEVFGLGDPVIAVDATRGNVYAADLRDGQAITALGLFRTTAALLNDPSSCPSGTHVADVKGRDTTAHRCWPKGIFVGAANPFQPFGTLVDKPHIRADQRRSGAGAGDVYVTFTRFGIRHFASEIYLSACAADFKTRRDCSKPLLLSGDDLHTQFSHIAVLPNGVVTITYTQENFIFDPNQRPAAFLAKDIKHVSCIPQGAPLAPKCSAATLVTTEMQTVPEFLTNASYRVSTYPTHDYRRLPEGGLEEVVVWSRCKQNGFQPIGIGAVEQVACPDADVVFTTAHLNKDGVPGKWGPVRVVDAGAGDQVFPWLAVDHETGEAHVAYLSSRNDGFHHRLQLMVSTLPAGAEKMDPPRMVLSTPSEPGSDAVLGASFIGDYIGMASHGGRTYVHSMINRMSTYDHILIPSQDNVLARLPGEDEP
jgi:hypothetical protein